MKKLLLIIGIIIVIAAIVSSGLLSFVNLEWLKDNQQHLATYVDDNPVTSQLYFVLIYFLMAALSIPGAVLMTLAGGALFGIAVGSVLVVTAASVGATMAFLISRYLLRDFIRNALGDRLSAINTGIEQEGAYYLFTLRLVPLFPFFLINVAMALTPLKAWTFFWVSLVGMSAGTIVYVNAGTQLAKLNAVSDILSAPLILSFVLLGLLPLLTKKMIGLINRYR